MTEYTKSSFGEIEEIKVTEKDKKHKDTLGEIFELIYANSGIPAYVLQDVDKRISDWRASGEIANGYIEQQLRYLKNVVKLLKK
jgi:hypothetical protein